MCVHLNTFDGFQGVCLPAKTPGCGRNQIMLGTNYEASLAEHLIWGDVRVAAALCILAAVPRH